MGERRERPLGDRVPIERIAAPPSPSDSAGLRFDTRADRQRNPQRRFAVLLAACLLVATGGGLPALAQPESHRAALGDRLERRLGRAIPGEVIAIRIRLKSTDLPPPGSAERHGAVRSRQDRVLAAPGRAGFRLKRRHVELAGFAGSADRATIEALRRDPEVLSVHLDGNVYASLAQGVPLMGGDIPHALGYTGEGINVAVIDSGIDTDHPHLSNDLIAEACFCDPSPPPGGCCPGGAESATGPGSAEDDNGHGTNVSAVITAGFNSVSPGMAPNAGIVAVKALDSAGHGVDSDIDAALDWVLLNRVTHGIKVVNMSLGDDTEHNNPNSSACTSSPTADAIASLHAVNIPVFAASGNEGFDNGIAAPACTPEAISVGGVYDENLGSVSWCAPTGCPTILCTDNPANTDTFVCHTNSDEILDILAPDWKTRVAKIGGGLENFGGTSAASPYAAGAAALLIEADPTLTPEQIRTLLKSHGTLVTNPDNGLSFRRSDIAAALASVAPCGDGSLQGMEECDDGNTADGDCCSAVCAFESNASSCDDADACTSADSCDGAGTCIGGSPLTCDDANACTDDSCDSGSGCVFTNNSDPCSDGNVCTSADACSGGACSAGPPLDCDDADPCTADGCDGVTGCFHSEIPECIPPAPVPATSIWGQAALLGSLAWAGALWLRSRRR
jgi:cysteine-rich repeat protein